ncbi:uncharacterized protein BDR25DRAFT_363155 [Lindgomyces ingoldianus]|uniref:Uncharacterized protein n=1 Tax=Lindgomyces ingoldianus TaxID=673940 RepID=A0ACB6Q836_9PLEO|nr:uncharacterized protein BDR25DRAFT_363155 [Lindgomyces ingoldianus]KAF2463068.1 hypothetical protein BDR25DRAFT_363155 [Lindgomyces ingoldianus]
MIGLVDTVIFVMLVLYICTLGFRDFKRGIQPAMSNLQPVSWFWCSSNSDRRLFTGHLSSAPIQGPIESYEVFCGWISSQKGILNLWHMYTSILADEFSMQFIGVLVAKKVWHDDMTTAILDENSCHYLFSFNPNTLRFLKEFLCSAVQAMHGEPHGWHTVWIAETILVDARVCFKEVETLCSDITVLDTAKTAVRV